MPRTRLLRPRLSQKSSTMLVMWGFTRRYLLRIRAPPSSMVIRSLINCSMSRPIRRLFVVSDPVGLIRAYCIYRIEIMLQPIWASVGIAIRVVCKPDIRDHPAPFTIFEDPETTVHLGEKSIGCIGCFDRADAAVCPYLQGHPH